MTHEQAQRLDLNVLLALDALISELSVTRAAQRLSVGQPAMSATLARLRKVFDDPLLVRDGHRLTPTPRALELVVPIRQALDLIEVTLRAHRGLDLALDQRTFRVMCSDYVLLVLLNQLFADLERAAPGVRLVVRPMSPDYREQLDRSQVDLLVLPDDLVDPATPARRQRLFSDPLVCAVDLAHPEVGSELTLEQFVSLPMVSLESPLPTINETRFRELGIERPVQIHAQSIVIQPFLLRGTRLMAMFPQLLGERFAEQAGIRLLTPPCPVAPVEETMIWSPRVDADPAHRWLRERVQRAAASLVRKNHQPQ